MARQVKLIIQPKDSSAPLSEYNYVRIFQDLHTHHSFEVSVPFDYLESRTASFMQKAHRELVGKPITFSLTPDATGTGGQFAFTGFVTDLVVASDNDYTGSFLIRGYSPTCLLTDGVQQRTFVNQTLDGIIGQVLQPYKANLLPTSKNLRSKAPLPYVVQYNESNFDFLNRLLGECHEWFFYDGAKLQFGLPEQGGTVQLEMNRQWSAFQLEAAIRPSKVAFQSYDPAQHQHWDGKNPATVSGISSNQFAQFALQTSNDVYTQPSNARPPLPAQSRNEVEEAAKAAGAALAAGSLVFRGRSENPDLRLGGLIDASAEGLGSDNLSVDSLGKYRIVNISHDVDYTGSYTNTFTAVLHSLELPPANPHARPQPGLPELAEVIDVQDPQKIGRVRVRYYWPVEKPTNAETPWVRVLTPYAGDGKGQLFTPEVGSQVLVHYEQHRAEQPVVLGNLFHNQNKQGAKYTNPQNNLKGMQTAGGNKFVMSDTPNEQKIMISNSNKKGTAIELSFKEDGSVSIKSDGPISLTAGGNITLTAAKDITLTAENVTINAKQKITKTAKEIALTGSDKVDMNGKATSIQAGDTMKIAASSSLDVTGGSRASISSGRTKIH